MNPEIKLRRDDDEADPELAFLGKLVDLFEGSPMDPSMQRRVMRYLVDRYGRDWFRQ